MAVSLSTLSESTQKQIAQLSDQIVQNNARSDQRFESVARDARDSVASVEARAKSEVRKTGTSLAAKLAEQQETQHQAQQQVAGELDELKQASSNAHSKLTEISGDISSVKGDVNNVKGDIASTQSELRQTGSELKRVTGDMGVMSGLIATNSKEVAELRELGGRDYLEFDLKKNAACKRWALSSWRWARQILKGTGSHLTFLRTTKRWKRKTGPSMSPCNSTWQATGNPMRSWSTR